ncbi:SGNH/GDSL hydrolase family protein [Polaromonas sp. SM01]|uniref:SGNH/GDSL hydrolase family protein n=1 Tax=Polaromonas sp. SM01 TaxID=3085630 RepID=UPI0029822A5D|nr:SGNH/GDSL hydrolase family protein [Polaromonas sp. SM01]MDW5441501.1 SGNH/GDSL hydrolase family protein [Polaromonas sp. SM01]
MTFKQTLAVLATSLALSAAPALAADPDAGHWVPSWHASQQPLWSGDFILPVNMPFNLSDQTLRQVARVSIGGARARVVLSNEYGKQAMTVGAASLALAGSHQQVEPASSRPLTFNGRADVRIPPGGQVISDPVALPLAPLALVSVSLYLPQPTAFSTFHWDARQKTYIGAGNVVAARDFAPVGVLTSRAIVSSILVDSPQNAGVVVAFGDSITDGNGSTMDANRRWPDFLAERLAPSRVAVLNAGISGARVLKDGMGSNASARLARDVLAQPGIRTVVVLLGINDIGWPGSAFEPDAPAVQAAQVIDGYRQLIARARAQGIRIVGATLPPFEGALQGTPLGGHFTPAKDGERRAINAWIRSSGAFDAVADFDAVLRDPQHPERLLPAWDSGDHLHPGDAGYQAMAVALDDALLFGESAVAGVASDRGLVR